jgi:hypothetical protein
MGGRGKFWDSARGLGEPTALFFEEPGSWRAKRGPHALVACFVPALAGSAFLNGVGADFQPLHHKIQQPLPARKMQIPGQRLSQVRTPCARSLDQHDHASGQNHERRCRSWCSAPSISQECHRARNFAARRNSFPRGKSVEGLMGVKVVPPATPRARKQIPSRNIRRSCSRWKFPFRSPSRHRRLLP